MFKKLELVHFKCTKKCSGAIIASIINISTFHSGLWKKYYFQYLKKANPCEEYLIMNIVYLSKQYNEQWPNIKFSRLR